jgi:UDP-N-acetylmuramoyl-L-alanyl-D-glutamate--2,6-diaminopimelate ligase
MKASNTIPSKIIPYLKKVKTSTVTLKALLHQIPKPEYSKSQENSLLGPLCLDSRQIQPGDTFIAMPGIKLNASQEDARHYISMAFEKGAQWIIAEKKDSEPFKALLSLEKRPMCIWIDSLREHLSLLASNYYQNPSNALTIIAVTGTNGKTSCTYLIAKALENINISCFLMGTLGIGFCHHLTKQNNTTADAIKIQSALSDALSLNASYASMEVSSHGIEQSRVQSVQFKSAILTNLTRDHLDYHGNMENYGKIKKQLLMHKNLENAIINMDDKWGQKCADDPLITAKKWFVSVRPPKATSNLNAWIWAEDVVFSLEGIHANILTPWGHGKLDSPLIGAFNLSNLLLVIAALGCQLKNIPLILSALNKATAPPGRMNTLGGIKKNVDASSTSPLVVVDYAHTPDALEKVLFALREHCSGCIYCIFGCGGDRDQGKRPLMAKIAEKLANKVIVTSDNPRMESQESIRKDIFDGFLKPEKVRYFQSRSEAIEYTIKKSHVGDAILVAGKGHEEFQIIGQQKIPFNDLLMCQKILEREASQ